jgi:Asp/Glu/hydantoin racemase
MAQYGTLFVQMILDASADRQGISSDLVLSQDASLMRRQSRGDRSHPSDYLTRRLARAIKAPAAEAKALGCALGSTCRWVEYAVVMRRAEDQPSIQ